MKMVDNNVDSARQLSISAMKNLKRYINIKIAGPQGPAAEFAGTNHTYFARIACVGLIVCVLLVLVSICVYAYVLFKWVGICMYGLD